MTFLPFERIVYRTQLTEDEVIRRLTEAVAPKQFVLFGFPQSSLTKPYEGEITGHTFAISRAIRYRNSFLPKITGTIQGDIAGTTIAVTMQLHPLVLIFLLVWISFVAQFDFISLSSLSALINGHPLDKMTLLPLGMISFVYVLTMGGFKVESRKSRNDLKILFNTETIENL